MKVTKSLFLCLALLCGAVAWEAQAPQWLQAVGAGGTLGDEGQSIAIDSQGNQYVTGTFSDIATFGSHTLTASGSTDIFAAKLDPSGNWLWAVRAGGTGLDIGYGIAVDNGGNTLFTGYFSGTATFGSQTLTASGGSDVFAAKLDPSGNWLWVVKAGGADSDQGSGIALDSSGNAYVSGLFSGTATFGSYNLTSSGSVNTFAAKLDPSGNWLWAVKAGGINDNRASRIALDEAGNAHITGTFISTATFGSHTITSNEDSVDIFAAKLDPYGNWLWAVGAGGAEWDEGTDIAVDGSGNAWVTGYFQGTVTFGNHTLTASGNVRGDIFVAKLDTSGNWLWAVRAGGTDTDRGYGIAVDGIGNAWLTGRFRSTAYFGNHALTASGSDDIYTAKMDTSGNWLWAVRAGGTNGDRGYGIVVDEVGNAWLTGSFRSTATFGSHTLTTNNYVDIFVAKLGMHPGAGIPVAPGNLSISINGSNVLLDWGDVAFDLAGNPVNVNHYLVYYCAIGPAGPFTVFGEDGSITQSQWTHSGVASLSPGFYYVTAVIAD